MIGATVSHYPALGDSASKRDSTPAVRDAALFEFLLWRQKRNRILEKPPTTSVRDGTSGQQSQDRSLGRFGGGGRGVVYKAHDTKLERLVALTFLPQHITLSKEANARILREAGAASSQCNSSRSDREDMYWH